TGEAPGGAGCEPHARPYPHAFEALVRIFEGLSEAGEKAGILRVMTQLPEQERVAGFLAEVAASAPTREMMAVAAVQYHNIDMGELGMETVKRLYETDAVDDPVVRSRLRAFASAHGWKRSTERIGDCRAGSRALTRGMRSG